MGCRVKWPVVVFALTWVGVHVVSACSSDAPKPVVDELADVIYAAGANDEALVALLDAPVVEDPEQAAHLLEPAPDVPLRRAEPANFFWRVGAPSAAHERSPNMLDALALIATAHAHGPPINGRGYLLLLKNEQGDVVYRAFTTDLNHLITPTAWGELTSNTTTITASVLHAVFINDAVAENGGPWLGPEVLYELQD